MYPVQLVVKYNTTRVHVIPLRFTIAKRPSVGKATTLGLGDGHQRCLYILPLLWLLIADCEPHQRILTP